MFSLSNDTERVAAKNKLQFVWEVTGLMTSTISSSSQMTHRCRFFLKNNAMWERYCGVLLHTMLVVRPYKGTCTRKTSVRWLFTCHFALNVIFL